MVGLGSTAPFKGGNALLEGGKPLFELCSGITAENALSKHRLADAIDASREFFVIPVELAVQRGNPALQLVVERLDSAADISEQTKRMVLRFRHG
jgi:hypothetical protein